MLKKQKKNSLYKYLIKYSLFFILIIILEEKSFSINIKSNEFCSTNNETTNIYKIYETKIYADFHTILQLKKFPEDKIPMLFCISKLESNFNPYAYNKNKNGTVDYGLFQINQVWNPACKNLQSTLEGNIDCAKIVLEKQGLNAWTSYRKYKGTCSNAYSKFKMLQNNIDK